MNQLEQDIIEMAMYKIANYNKRAEVTLEDWQKLMRQGEAIKQRMQNNAAPSAVEQLKAHSQQVANDIFGDVMKQTENIVKPSVKSNIKQSIKPANQEFADFARKLNGGSLKGGFNSDALFNEIFGDLLTKKIK